MTQPDEPYTIDDVLARLGRPGTPTLSAPAYEPGPDPADKMGRPKIGLAVESMKRHMTDEGWQIFAGLEASGYFLQGHGLHVGHPEHGDRTHLPRILDYWMPRGYGGTMVVQDKREWDPGPRDFRVQAARFTGVECLAGRPDIFKVTILKDAHQRPDYHRDAAAEMGCHAWVVYYHPRIVHHLAPYTRPMHLIRTYHTVDRDVVPLYDPSTHKGGCVLSGAVSRAYPLRERLAQHSGELPYTSVLRHPGYHRNGCATPAFLRTLTRYRVAICTASIYGYALRKIVEATAAGCVVVTDLPADEVLPEIDGNLVRVRPDVTIPAMHTLLDDVLDDYDPDRQAEYSRKALAWYDYRAAGFRLTCDLERLRVTYNERT